VHHVVELEIDVDLADPVVEVGEPADLPVHMLDQSCVGVEMHRLDVDVHDWILRMSECFREGERLVGGIQGIDGEIMGCLTM
jgi:hypothetical protein